MPIDETIVYVHGEWFLRILMAGICGIVIGYERSNRNKEAGMKTHAIVAIGAALMMVISKYGFYDSYDFDGSRVAAQIVSGVGFLGAGIIFIRHHSISGLTTAAGIWATSGVGMSMGAGIYDIGIFSTLLILALQMLFHQKVFQHVMNQGIVLQFEIIPLENAFNDIQKTLKHYDIELSSLKSEILDNGHVFIECGHVTMKSEKREYLLKEMLSKNYIKMFRYI